MKILVAFFRLIRWPNLLFIAITQCLFFFCVFNSVLKPAVAYHYVDFFLLVAASIFIAAAGYIINDYFDRQIDAINKPDRVVLDSLVKRRWAIIWHLIFSFAGVMISIYISWRSGNWLIALGNILCVFLLWFYSTNFKKKLLIGNIIISALTAWVIFVIYFSIPEVHQISAAGIQPRLNLMSVNSSSSRYFMPASLLFIPYTRSGKRPRRHERGCPI